MSDAQFDVVVFGATSFVGQILCQYLTDTYGVDGDLKWAAAGRSKDKLEQVKAQLGQAGSALPLPARPAASAARSACTASMRAMFCGLVISR